MGSRTCGVQSHEMKTYIFRAVVEPDEDRWSAYCPALLKQGAATWGYTEEEALKSLQEVVHMVLESLIEHGEPVPDIAMTCATSRLPRSRGSTLWSRGTSGIW